MPPADGHVPDVVALLPAPARFHESLLEWSGIDSDGGASEIQIRYKLPEQLVKTGAQNAKKSIASVAAVNGWMVALLAFLQVF